MPVKPHYTYVDAQLSNLEEDLSEVVPYNLNMNYWLEFDHIQPYDDAKIIGNIQKAFQPLTHVYRNSPKVIDAIWMARVLLHSCAWVALNVICPDELHAHRLIGNVRNNLWQVYDRQVAPVLKGAMIEANHHCEVIQRVWRRCDTDPRHPMCRRRLDRQFHEDITELKRMIV